MFYLCLFARLSVCPVDYSKRYERILMKIFRAVGCGQSNKRLDFGGDPDHGPDPGFFYNDSLFTIAIPIDGSVV